MDFLNIELYTVASTTKEWTKNDMCLTPNCICLSISHIMIDFTTFVFNFCENHLLIGQKQYSIIKWTNQRGCIKNPIYVWGNILKPCHDWFTFRDITKLEIMVICLFCTEGILKYNLNPNQPTSRQTITALIRNSVKACSAERVQFDQVYSMLTVLQKNLNGLFHLKFYNHPPSCLEVESIRKHQYVSCSIAV